MSEVHTNKIYVRVKRGREEDPAENLCIVEEAAPAKKRSTWTDPAMGITSTPSTTNLLPRKLILSRVRTLRCADDALIHESSNMVDYAMEEEQPVKRKRVTAKVIVTSGTKTVTSDSAESYVIIDMAQLPTKGQTDKKQAPVSVSAINGSPASKVLDPATRMLERGIDIAVKNGDFNEISSALMQGANAEHQSKTNGFTSLMAATLQCNVRMVKRLLMKGVDVHKTNKEGLIALELLKGTQRNMKDAIEIQNLLQAAAAKAAQPSSMRAATVRENIKRSNDHHRDGKREGAMELDEDYVYDIYCVNTDGGAELNAPESSAAAEMSEDPSALSAEDPLYSIVRVEGLRIHEDGKVELMMAYDSDWSDLGDDEEPDSNDERFFGNDYPEDEENEGEELVEDSDEEMAPYRAAQQKHAQRREAAQGAPGEAQARSRTQPAGSAAPSAHTSGGGKQAASQSKAGRGVRFAGGTVGGAGTGTALGEETLDVLEAQEAEYTFEDELSDPEAEAEHGQGQGYSTYYDGEGDGECDDEGGDCDLREGNNSDYDMDADDAAEAAELAQHRDALLGGNRGSKQPPASQQPAQRRPGPFAGKSRSPRNTQLQSDSDLLYGDDDNLPAFERRFGVGKVLRPQLILDHHGAGDDDNFANQGLYEEPHNTESLQALWGEEEGNREDYAGAESGRGQEAGTPDASHGDRLQHMRQRTGMVFAAAAREFDPHTGLAKYGADLSDDEGIMDQGELIEAERESASGCGGPQGRVGLVGRGMGVGLGKEARGVPQQQPQRMHVYRSTKPPADTVAYDSELDASD